MLNQGFGIQIRVLEKKIPRWLVVVRTPTLYSNEAINRKPFFKMRAVYKENNA